MRTIVIVQARLRSTRLPAKILLPLPTGRTVLQEVVHRCFQIPGIDDVVVAMPQSAESMLILPFIGDARPYYGPEDDVLARYAGAAALYKAGIVVRVTSDCPLIDPILCGKVIRHREQHGQCYSYNNMPVGDSHEGTFPKGLDVEVFTYSALEWHCSNNRNPEAREHVTADLRRSVQGSDQPMNPAGDYSNMRWTLDTIDDYARICALLNDERAHDQMLALLKRFRA